MCITEKKKECSESAWTLETQRGHRMQNSLYKLFEHKCVLEVCVLGMARYHNFGFGTIPEYNTSVSILNLYHR